MKIGNLFNIFPGHLRVGCNAVNIVMAVRLDLGEPLPRAWVTKVSRWLDIGQVFSFNILCDGKKLKFHHSVLNVVIVDLIKPRNSRNDSCKRGLSLALYG